LHHARHRRAEPAAELVGRRADEAGEHGDGHRREQKREHGCGSREMSCRSRHDKDSGQAQLDEVAASHLHIIGP
jgi:hypothetical protein